MKTNMRHRFTIKSIKICVGMMVITVAYLARFLVIPTEDFPTIEDKSFDWTQKANDLVLSSETFAYALEISSSLLIDSNLIGMIWVWFRRGSSCRVLIAGTIFYGVRSLI
jgi:hypothetical protein